LTLPAAGHKNPFGGDRLKLKNDANREGRALLRGRLGLGEKCPDYRIIFGTREPRNP